MIDVFGDPLNPRVIAVRDAYGVGGDYWFGELAGCPRVWLDWRFIDIMRTLPEVRMDEAEMVAYLDGEREVRRG